MKDRMRAIYPIVREHMETAQRQQQASYNRPTQPREFKPGDRVLVLVPTVECKFLASWQGPYEVIERVGEVNYKVRQPDKRKTEQIYHVNLLKQWHAREALFCCLPQTESKAPAREEVQVGPGLSPHQRQRTLELVDRNRDVFSSLPGHTEVVQHEIRTVPGRTVTQRPYRVPEARRVAIEQEVEKMLELGVIENSKSAWASPIVLVPKPDGLLAGAPVPRIEGEDRVCHTRRALPIHTAPVWSARGTGHVPALDGPGPCSPQKVCGCIFR
ncbi:uncharacterized protein LOC134438971 [Engraulis encrasicolus]|uniref:uncharacterized protein LOC134438971 n=1 Tax=Engraulis encrasicolus TaxID=184585 RepID=UPI002FD228DA